MDFDLSENLPRQLDQDDPLQPFRQRFAIPKAENGLPSLYFCGNSLGLMPKAAKANVEEELNAWEELAVEGHFKAKNGWYSYHETVTDSLAEIVGCLPSEVVAMNSLTTNLHLLMVSFYRPSGRRKKILIERGAFPSDYYAVKSQLHFHGLNPDECLIEASSELNAQGEATSNPSTAEILDLIHRNKDDLALVMLSGVQYLTGQAFELDRITAESKKLGITVGLDLAHAAGNIDLKLHDWGVDFAAWCHYKYLNGGPGTIAGAFVHQRHHNDKNLPRFAGWWGHNKHERFKMVPDFDPMPSAEAWQLSNPPILQLAALRASVELFRKASMPRLRAKSVLLTNYLEFLLKRLPGHQVDVITPHDPSQRGAQLSLRIKENGDEFLKRLRQENIICDFRHPNIVRIAPVPLYNNFVEVYTAAKAIKGA